MSEPVPGRGALFHEPVRFASARAPAGRRRNADATEVAINALRSEVAGNVQAAATAARETAAGLWSRAMATAVVPDGVPVTSRMLAEAARSVALTGECLYWFGDDLSFVRAARDDVWGPADPAQWWYRLRVNAPKSHVTLTAPAADVLHVRYSSRATAPARGISPLALAASTGDLFASLERSLGYEAATAVAFAIPLPDDTPEERDDSDGTVSGEADAVIGVRDYSKIVREAKGRIIFPRTTQDDNTESRPPARDWDPARLGPNPPMALVHLRQHVENSILTVYGVPVSLGPQGLSDGTMARESIRRFWTTTIRPLSRLFEDELSRVLERPIRLRWPQEAHVDVAAKARALKILLADGTLKRDEAFEAVGWDLDFMYPE